MKKDWRLLQEGSITIISVIYQSADTEMKKKILQKIKPLNTKTLKGKSTDKLMDYFKRYWQYPKE